MWFRRKSSKSTAPKLRPHPVREPMLTAESEPTLRRVRLPVDLLQRGMNIIKLDRPWTEVPVLFQGFILCDDAQAEILRQYCDWVLVEDEEERLNPIMDRMVDLKELASTPLPETCSLAEELPRAREAWTQGQSFIDKVTRDIASGEELDFDQARPFIQQCVESIQANASAMFWMSRIKSRDSYTAEHCLRVAIFSIAFARFIGVPDNDLEIVGMCGLLHDLGKLKVPESILNKPGELTAEEAEAMRAHTTLGYQLLREDRKLDPIISDVSSHHHERIDGQGYPHQLADWQISRFARLVSIVDAFDAITSDRCYRDGLSTSEAMSILYKNRGQQFDAGMVEAFIRMIGVYPPGSLVELSSGEVALVVATHPGRKLKPRVEILLDANKNPTPPRVVDLGTQTGNTSADTEIAHPLADGAFGISLRGRIQQLTANAFTHAL
ncbi:HD-GYP domain-containing protein [Marinobacter salinisoli]|uniref:HD-GYP domain-containing protein n=1 Tax=Marinobacter salinisoli TaxID=2769486 RepID=A0ABX7MSR4_9GAMM|nr:HD-GYP domain-containing protein [Marinobacter salinisoli]QSP95425.1 HD-GYP domain-containing protein [Marinobacter salinisoli]